MNSAYSEVYHIVDKNFKNATGNNLPFSENVYLSNCEISPNICDVSALPSSNGMDFLNSLYTVIYNHLMSEEAQIYWKAKVSEHPDNINEIYLYSVLRSVEYSKYSLRKIKNYTLYNKPNSHTAKNNINLYKTYISNIYNRITLPFRFLFSHILVSIATLFSKIPVLKSTWRKIPEKTRHKITHFLWGAK